MVKLKVVFVSIFMMTVITAMAQNPIVSELDMSWSYESTPSFDNDPRQDKLLNFIRDNMEAIDTLKYCKTVYVQFEVDTLGYTSNHIVLKGVNEQLNNEALRICRLIKFDHPAKKGGRPASIIYTLPIKFEPKASHIPMNKKSCRCEKCSTHK